MPPRLEVHRYKRVPPPPSGFWRVTDWRERFQAACATAKVRKLRFHDLRHTFGTTLAAAGVPLRTIQEYLGHAGLKPTQIDAHHAPSAREVDQINAAFAADRPAMRDGPRRSTRRGRRK